MTDNRDFESRIRSLMKSATIPGLSIFTAREGIEHVAASGVRNCDTQEPVNALTVFEAASLSKPVLAHAVLQLIDAGRLDLDEPLLRLAGPLVPDDPAAAHITTRHVLSHTTGLPNWRRPEFPLRTYFPPGTRFSYSGEGYAYLQTAIERLMGEPLETTMKRLVLQPFGMHRSSYVWQKSFSENAAAPHDAKGRVGTKFKPANANAAYSLHTTAADYGRFLVAVMSKARLKEATARLWTSPQIQTPKRRFEMLEEGTPETEPRVAWGLGWGVEPDAGTFFHWGANPGATAFVLGAPAERSALAVFMNSDVGLDIVPSIIETTMPGPHPSLSWLGLSQKF